MPCRAFPDIMMANDGEKGVAVREQRSYVDYTYFVVMSLLCASVALAPTVWLRHASGLEQVPASAAGLALEGSWLLAWGWLTCRHARRAWNCLRGWLE